MTHSKRTQFTLVSGSYRPRQGELFPSGDPLVGLRVQLNHAVRGRHCHNNFAEIVGGRGPHGYALWCTVCGAHCGWLPKAAADALRREVRSTA